MFEQADLGGFVSSASPVPWTVVGQGQMNTLLGTARLPFGFSGEPWSVAAISSVPQAQSSVFGGETTTRDAVASTNFQEQRLLIVAVAVDEDAAVGLNLTSITTTGTAARITAQLISPHGCRHPAGDGMCVSLLWFVTYYIVVSVPRQAFPLPKQLSVAWDKPVQAAH